MKVLLTPLTQQSEMYLTVLTQPTLATVCSQLFSIQTGRLAYGTKYLLLVSFAFQRLALLLKSTLWLWGSLLNAGVSPVRRKLLPVFRYLRIVLVVAKINGKCHAPSTWDILRWNATFVGRRCECAIGGTDVAFGWSVTSHDAVHVPCHLQKVCVNTGSTCVIRDRKRFTDHTPRSSASSRIS